MCFCDVLNCIFLSFLITNDYKQSNIVFLIATLYIMHAVRLYVVLPGPISKCRDIFQSLNDLTSF